MTGTQRSFLDEHDRRKIGNARDKTVMWVFLLIVVAFAIAYWPIVLVIVGALVIWVLSDRAKNGFWVWNSNGQPSTQPTGVAKDTNGSV